MRAERRRIVRVRWVYKEATNEMREAVEIFFFNDTATTEIYTLSLTTLFRSGTSLRVPWRDHAETHAVASYTSSGTPSRMYKRSEEHTSELQSRQYLVCRLLLEKKKIISLVSSACKFVLFTTPQFRTASEARL